MILIFTHLLHEITTLSSSFKEVRLYVSSKIYIMTYTIMTNTKCFDI